MTLLGAVAVFVGALLLCEFIIICPDKLPKPKRRKKK